MGATNPVKIEDFNNFSDPHVTHRRNTWCIVCGLGTSTTRTTSRVTRLRQCPVDKPAKKKGPSASSVVANVAKTKFLLAIGSLNVAQVRSVRMMVKKGLTHSGCRDLGQRGGGSRSSIFTKFLARNIWPTGYSTVLIVRARGRNLRDGFGDQVRSGILKRSRFSDY